MRQRRLAKDPNMPPGWNREEMCGDPCGGLIWVSLVPHVVPTPSPPSLSAINHSDVCKAYNRS